MYGMETAGKISLGWGLGMLTAAVISQSTGHDSSDFDKARNRVHKYANTPCQYEDSVNCHWNARTQGNRKGVSFTAILQHDKVYVFYSNGQIIVDNVYRGTETP